MIKYFLAFLGILFVSLIILLGYNNKSKIIQEATIQSSPTITPNKISPFMLPTSSKVQSNICGGWDTSGEIICACSGTLIKSTCPPNVICDGSSYTCTGTCGKCCYKGVAENTEYPKCKQ